MRHKASGLRQPVLCVSSVLCAALWLLDSGSDRTGKKQFRVCADPENLPFSNRELEGFENKIAELMAKELGASPSYVWWGQRRGSSGTP